MQSFLCRYNSLSDAHDHGLSCLIMGIVVGINIIDTLSLLLAFYKTIDMCQIKIVIYT
jgi:hypothetical protein